MDNLKELAVNLIAFFGLEAGSYDIPAIVTPESFLCDSILIDGLAKEIETTGHIAERDELNLSIRNLGYFEAMDLTEKLNGKIRELAQAIDDKQEYPDLHAMRFKLDRNFSGKFTDSIYLD